MKLVVEVLEIIYVYLLNKFLKYRIIFIFEDLIGSEVLDEIVVSLWRIYEE